MTKAMDILQALIALPQSFAGRGINHEGEAFTGALAIRPLVGGRAILLNYTATLADGRRVHAEATLLGRNAEGKLCLWPVMEELPAVIPHVEIAAASSSAHVAAATFASGPREAAHVFREEIAIRLGHDGRLTYAHSWGLPHGSFEARSSCEMLPSAL
jgi:hypothetical protein